MKMIFFLFYATIDMRSMMANEIGVHVLSNLGYFICLRNLFRSSAETNLYLSQKKLTSFKHIEHVATI